jgi:hypothetical protein
MLLCDTGVSLAAGNTKDRTHGPCVRLWDRDGYRARVMHLATQVDELRAGGSRAETIFPDGDSLTAFGVRLYIPN